MNDALVERFNHPLNVPSACKGSSQRRILMPDHRLRCHFGPRRRRTLRITPERPNSHANRQHSGANYHDVFRHRWPPTGCTAEPCQGCTRSWRLIGTGIGRWLAGIALRGRVVTGSARGRILPPERLLYGSGARLIVASRCERPLMVGSCCFAFLRQEYRDVSAAGESRTHAG